MSFRHFALSNLHVTMLRFAVFGLFLFHSCHWNSVNAQDCTLSSQFNLKPVDTECPNNYHEHKNTRFCYRAVFKKSRYNEASKFCAKNGGFLAAISDPKINYFLYELIFKQYGVKFDQAPMDFWMGLDDRKEEGSYQWSRCDLGFLENGTFINWLLEEVKNTSVPYDPEHSRNCVTWQWSMSPGWKTQSCLKKFNFICQVEFSPPTSSASPVIQSVTDQPTQKLLAAALPITYIVAICVGGVIFLTIVLLAVFYRIQKRNHEKKRNELLKRTGIFPAVSDVVSTAQKIAWIKTAK